MELADILQDIESDLFLRVATPDGKSYVLLYALAGRSPVLPTAEVVTDRWRNITDLSRTAFGCLDCTIVGLNGKVTIQAQASHISWSQGSVPFIFVEESCVQLAEIEKAAATTNE